MSDHRVKAHHHRPTAPKSSVEATPPAPKVGTPPPVAASGSSFAPPTVTLTPPLKGTSAVGAAIAVAPDEVVAAAKNRGDLNALKAYLAAGGSPNACDKEMIMPLHQWAAVRGNYEAFMLMFPTVDLGQQSPLHHGLTVHMAAQSSKVEGATKIMEAIMRRDPTMMEELWRGLNWHTPFLESCYNLNAATAKRLGELGADLAACGIRNKNGQGWVDGSAPGQKLKVVLDELKAPANHSPESEAYFQKLLATHSEIQPPAVEGEALRQRQLATQAQVAMTNILSGPREGRDAGFKALADLIEKQGLNPNTLAGLQQQPALVYVISVAGAPSVDAAETEDLRVQIAKYLLSHGADPRVHEVSPMHSVPLFRANVQGKLKFCEALIESVPPAERPAFVNLQGTANGFTALHDAIIRADPQQPDRIELVHLLLRSGATCHHETYSGDTERDLALQCGVPEVIEAVQAAFAQATTSAK